MPEEEGYLGIISLLENALENMSDGDAKRLVKRALVETFRQAHQSLTSLEMGLELGSFLEKQNDPQMHEVTAERERIVAALRRWRKQYEQPPAPGPLYLDIDALCRTCVDSAIKIVEQG